MAKKKRPQGRPPKPEGDKLKARYMLKMHPDEKSDYHRKASVAGLKLAEWIRRTLNRAKR
jgi:hypothetical protein